MNVRRPSQRPVGVDVRDWGADPSLADNKAAIDAAIAALPPAPYRGILQFGPGQYVTSGGHVLDASSRVRVRGVGHNGSVLYLKNGANADLLTLLGQFQSVESMAFDGNYPSNLTSGRCVVVQNTKVRLRDLWIANARLHGIHIVGTAGTPAHAAMMDNIYVLSCQGSGVFGDSFAYDLQSNNLWIGSCNIGLQIGSTQQAYNNLHVWGCVSDGVKGVAGDDCRFQNAYLETNGGHGANLNGVRGWQFQGAMVRKNTGNGVYAFNSDDLHVVGRVRDNALDGVRFDGSSKYGYVEIHSGNEESGGQKYGVRSLSTADYHTLRGKMIAAQHGTGSYTLVGANNKVDALLLQ